MPNLMSRVVLIVAVILMVSQFAYAQPQVTSEDPDINKLMLSPWLQHPKTKETIITVGDAYQKHFGSTDWGKYSDNQGNKYIGFKGAFDNGTVVVPMEFYFNYKGALKAYKMGDNEEDVRMGIMLLARLVTKDADQWKQENGY